jgi:hypothetical protein
MHSLSRRRFLGEAGAFAAAALTAGPWASRALAGAERHKLPVAGVVTEYRDNSHADVILGKILEGFDQLGGPGPDLQLVSLYTDQVPESDWSRELARKHGFRIAQSIDEAVTLGTDEVAVAGVFSIAEHGAYAESPDTKQIMYPRRRFFDEITAAFRRCGTVVPLFNDKHLAWNWTDAKQMYDTAQELAIPFMAGSSLPVTWRKPALTLPMGCQLTEALVLGYGPLEGYGIHALEGLQCMVERRRGGETGVAAVQTVSGPAIWETAQSGRWSRPLFDAALAAVPPYRQGRPEDLLWEDAAWYLIEYRDGLKACLAMANGATAEWVFAGSLADQTEPAVTWFRAQEWEPFAHFSYLLKGIEEMIHTGRPSWPVERTLLTTGILHAAMRSLAAEGQRIETPELAIAYQSGDWPFAPGDPPPMRA